MSRKSDESFAALVDTANPAASGYYQQNSNNLYLHSHSHPNTSGYPPPQQPNLMDPFFDDDDDDGVDAHHSTFPMYSVPQPLHSQESGLPLARSAAPPAGIGASSVSLATTTNGQPQGWTFDDDALSPAFSTKPSFPGEQSATSPRPLTRSRRWKWPWQREREFVNERVIALNNPHMNDEYCSNFVSTSKYNSVTFLPKFLTGMCRLGSCAEANALFAQNNFRNMPIYFFCSLHAFSRSLVYHQRTSTRQLHLWLLSFLHPHSRKLKKTSCVPRFPIFLFLPRLRSDINQIQSSTPDLARRYPGIHSSTGSGKIYVSATSCASSQISLSQLI